MRILNIDWLEIYCIEQIDQPRDAEFFRAQGFKDYEYIFKSRKGNNKHIGVQAVSNILKEAGEYYLLTSCSDISKVCRGKQKSAGKHPVTGEKLIWKYIEEE